MVILLKSVLVIFCLAITAVAYSIFDTFKSDVKSEQYENSSIIGRIITIGIFVIIIAALLTLFLFLFYLILSKISIIGVF